MSATDKSLYKAAVNEVLMELAMHPLRTGPILPIKYFQHTVDMRSG